MITIDCDTITEALKRAKKMARKRNIWLQIEQLGQKWIVTDYNPEHWQGWHWSQLINRPDLVVTPNEVLTADVVPIIYEDYNCPGMFYKGTAKDQQKLEEDGGFAGAVSTARSKEIK